MRFLETLRIPVIATLRDSQNYVRAAEQGVGLHEMKKQLVEQDLADWEPLLGWLRAKEASEPPRNVNPLQETA
jgi:chromosome partitioning protein